MLVQVLCDAGSRNLALVHSDVEAMSSRCRLNSCHRLLSQKCNLSGLLKRCLVIGCDMPVGADKQMPCVVRKKI